MLQVKRVEKFEEDYDNYLDDLGMNYGFHLKNNICVIGEIGIVELKIFTELDLKVASCDYGIANNSEKDYLKMDNLAELIKEKFGDVYWGEEGGLYINLEITLKDNSKAIYFIAGGNKGQELCVGMHIQSLEQLKDEELRKTISNIDKWLYRAIQKSKLDKF